MEISEVKTADGMIVQSNHESQAELEAQNAPPESETPEILDAKVAAVPDREPETGKFTKTKKTSPRSDPYARVTQATAKEAEAKRERDEIAAERDTLRAELDEARKAKTPETASAPAPAVNPVLPPTTQADWKRYRSMPGYPTKEEYGDDYPAAVSQFVTDVRMQEHHAFQQESTLRTRSESRATDIRNKITDNGTNLPIQQAIDVCSKYAAGQQLTPDEQAIMQSSPISARLLLTPPLSALPAGSPRTFGNYLIEQAFRSHHTREILIHLSNDQEVQRLATLPPDEVVWEIARLDAIFAPAAAARSTGTVPEVPPRSQAKPVFSPVAGSATKAAPDGPPGEDATDAEVEAYYAPLRKRYSRGR